MNLWKRFSQVTIVIGAVGLMYTGANQPAMKETSMAAQSSVPKEHGSLPQSETEIESDTDAKITEIVSAETSGSEPEGEKLSEKETFAIQDKASAGASLQKKTNNKTSLKNETESESLSETESSELSEAESSDSSEIESESSDPEDSRETESETSTKELSSETESEVSTSETSSESETESDTENIVGDHYEISVPSDSYKISPRAVMVPSYESLRKDLDSMLDTYEGIWSIYLKDLKTGATLTINDHPQDSASLIKLYIAGAVLEEIQNGNLEATESIDRLLSDMISLSDNEAANELVRCLSDEHSHQDGLIKVNQFIENHDFMDTHQYNGLEDPNLWYGDEVNITSVRDCGRFLEMIYEGDMISHLASRQLEGYLLDQDITWKIPAGIPSEVPTANKTGEKDNTQNDVSIVYSPYGDYILCIMATNLTDEDSAVEHIRALSGHVYGFFTEGEYLVVEHEPYTDLSTESEISE